MKYRSISSHRSMPDPQVIDLAASLGFKPVPHPTGAEGLVRMVLELDN